VKEQKLDQALEECLSLLEQGQATMEECLDRYPHHADELHVLLSIALETRRVSLPSPSPEASAAWRQRIVDALAARTSRRSVLAALAQHLKQMGRYFRRIPQPLLTVARLTAPVFLVLAVGASLYLLIGTPGAHAATLTNARGTVEILRAGGDTWQQISTGHQVGAGDRIRAAQSSGAILTLPNGSTVDLKANTDVDLLKIRGRRYTQDSWHIVLHQRTGQTSNCLRCPENETYRFEVRTQNATVIARGTEFSVRVRDDGATDVAVVEGRVAVTAVQTTRWVEAGQMTSVQPKQPPAPILPIPTRTPEVIMTSAPRFEAGKIETHESADSHESIKLDKQGKEDESTQDKTSKPVNPLPAPTSR
jgi:hypothetical protein